MSGGRYTNNTPMGRTKQLYDLILRLWPLYKVGLWLGKQPGIGRVIKPVFSEKIHQVTMIPVNEPIIQGSQTVLPYAFLQQLVERSDARFIMAECVCRIHENCQEHPADLGCLFLGEGAGQIHPSLGRQCSVDEACGHIQRGMSEGLYPLIAHTVIDAITLGIPYRKMLTVCFCCECCCVVHRGLRKGPASLLQVVQRIPGLHVLVSDSCSGCAECLEKCPVGAISLTNGVVEISANCKGCGICVNSCPSGSIRLEWDGEVDLQAGFFRRIDSYADVSAALGK